MAATAEPITLEQFNRLGDADARAPLLACCGSGAWAGLMLARRPLASFDDLLIAADESFAAIAEKDWMEAFAAHPKIGQDAAALREKFAATADWSSTEQSGVARASDEELAALAEGNRDYLAKFGYIFIVCATGKSARDMLDLLVERIEHTPEEELPVAATEQMKITHLRLHKMIADAI
jgi:2-oxo-4-hydroxy-4-carboxy-5-ureidoimidazoline decarboxylase